MGIYSEKAVENFEKGYNCAQSVLLAFADKIGFEQEQALMIASSFGGGMGRLREVCGAVSMMFLIAGIKRGYVQPDNDVLKEEHYRYIQDLAQKFKDEHGTIICRELLGLDIEGADSPVPSKRTQEYYESRPCEFFIKHVAEIIENEIL